MAKTRGRCVYTAFTKKILCAGTLRDWLIIEERTYTAATSPGAASGEQFVTVDECAGYLESVRGTPRFNGVTVDDDRTHVGYIPYDQAIYELDRGSLWIRKEGARDRRFKLINIRPYDEEDMYLQLDLQETGFADLEAAEA